MQQSKAFKRLPNTHKKNQGLDSLRALDSVSYFGTVCVGRQLVG